MSQDLLTDLIRAGPNPRYTLKVLVLERFDDITTARQLMRTWPDIAEALGYPRQSWKTLAAAYRRVDAGLKAGRLVKLAGGNKSSLRIGAVVKNGNAEVKNDAVGDMETKTSRIKFIGPQ